MMAKSFLGRQPIIDAERNVFGYELLYRGATDSATLTHNPDRATSAVMERVLNDWGLYRVVGDRVGLLNASGGFVVAGQHEAMPADALILEIREPEPFDDDTIDAIRLARRDGYRFALDNVASLDDIERSRLLPLARIVKIDLGAVADHEIPEIIAVARRRSPLVLVIAEKVETVADYKRCVRHGFDLFQGWFHARPTVMRHAPRPVATAAAAELVHHLDSEAIDADRVEAIIATDPTLAFRLLAVVNANPFGLDLSVSSIRQAIGLLGIDGLRDLARQAVGAGATVDHPELFERATVRGRMAAALLAGTDLVDDGVTAALLSLTDRIYHEPIGDLLDELAINRTLRGAVIHGHGPVGRALDVIRACERRDPAAVDYLAPGRRGQLLDLYDQTVADERNTSATTPTPAAADSFDPVVDDLVGPPDNSSREQRMRPHARPTRS